MAKKIDELQEILRKKDEDMKQMEERYKRYVEKARTVRTCSPQSVVLKITVRGLLFNWLKGNSTNFYRVCVQVFVSTTACIKPFGSPERTGPHLINYFKWYNLSWHQLVPKSLKKIWGYGVKKIWTAQTCVAHSSSLLGASISLAATGK